MLEKFSKYSKHDGLVDRLSDEVKKELSLEFCSVELADLNKLNLPLQASRYPWDAELRRHIDLGKWTCMARRLNALIAQQQPEM